jgi:hypothetical protein
MLEIICIVLSGSFRRGVCAENGPGGGGKAVPSGLFGAFLEPQRGGEQRVADWFG